MRLLILSRYSRLGASSRLRTMQYLPYLREAGFDVEVSSLFDDAYLDALYAAQPVRHSTAGYFARRVAGLLAQRHLDLVWLEIEAFPGVPWLLEKLLLPSCVPLVSDYDDAVFHRYDLHQSKAVRALLGSKIDGVMAASNLVTAGNSYLGTRAQKAGARRVELIPTVVDVNAYSTQRIPSRDGKLRIGWIGTPTTWVSCIMPIINQLRDVCSSRDAVFRAVGASLLHKQEDSVEHEDWTEESEVSLIQGMDIGIMPLPDISWARGKCGYKLIQYMACGLPVVASPVGVNCEIVEHGVNGFLAETEAEWREALTLLLSDPHLRYEMGVAGRQKVERSYSLQVYGPRVATLLRDVAIGQG